MKLSEVRQLYEKLGSDDLNFDDLVLGIHDIEGIEDDSTQEEIASQLPALSTLGEVCAALQRLWCPWHLEGRYLVQADGKRIASLAPLLTSEERLALAAIPAALMDAVYRLHELKQSQLNLCEQIFEFEKHQFQEGEADVDLRGPDVSDTEES